MVVISFDFLNNGVGASLLAPQREAAKQPGRLINQYFIIATAGSSRGYSISFSSFKMVLPQLACITHNISNFAVLTLCLLIFDDFYKFLPQQASMF